MIKTWQVLKTVLKNFYSIHMKSKDIIDVNKKNKTSDLPGSRQFF